MRIRHIELFQAVLRTGSLTSAAALMSITQPAASKLLAHAESSLGFKLFERVKGRLQLTREAEILIPSIDKVFRDLDDVRRLSRSLRVHSKGILRLGCTPSLGLELLPRTLNVSQRENPDLTIDLRTSHSSQLVEALLAREITVAFMFNPLPHPGLKSIHIADVRMVHVDGSDNAEPIAISDISFDSVISLPALDPVGDLIQPYLPEGESRLRVQTYYVACALAQAGTGIALIDIFTATALLKPGQAGRPVVPALPLTLAAVVHESTPLSKLETDLIDCVQRLAVDWS